MRQLVGWLAVLGLVASLAGCYKGRGICDCLDYHDHCTYGGFLCKDGCQQAPPMQPVPPIKAEPLKVMPKEIEEKKAPAVNLPEK